MQDKTTTIRVWVTKYALSGGIYQREVEAGSSDGLVIDRCSGFMTYYHGEGREWHRTWESAAAKAEQMRQDKIASLQKQITKLQRMAFKEPADA